MLDRTRKSGKRMTTEEAILIAIERNGRPREDDWELAEAAKVLTSAVAQINERLGEAMRLLEEVETHLIETEECPNGTWFRRYFLLTGDHMILTDEGWEPGEAKQSYLDAGDADAIQDEINIPVPE